LIIDQIDEIAVIYMRMCMCVRVHIYIERERRNIYKERDRYIKPPIPCPRCWLIIDQIDEIAVIYMRMCMFSRVHIYIYVERETEYI